MSSFGAGLVAQSDRSLEATSTFGFTFRAPCVPVRAGRGAALGGIPFLPASTVALGRDNLGVQVQRGTAIGPGALTRDEDESGTVCSFHDQEPEMHGLGADMQGAHCNLILC
jgi:hypothetical protein